MMFGTTKLKVLAGAESAIKAWRKVAKALQNEVSTLQGLITSRVEADRALVAAETAAALGEQADVPAARSRADDALVAIDRKAVAVAGLRARLASQAPGLEGQIRGIQKALPGYVSGIKADFQDEWKRGIATFAVLLGKRRSLEAVIGKLDLTEPQAAVCELGDDVAAPWDAVKELTAALEQIAAWSRGAAWPASDAMGGRLKPYDPRGIYVLTRPFDELAAGALVMECSLAPGYLDHLVQIEYAVSLVSQEWQQGVEVGRAAVSRILYEEHQTRVQEVVPPSYTAAELEEFRKGAESNKNLVAETFYPAHGGRVSI